MQPVRVARHGDVALVTLDRPARRNAFDAPAAAALHDAVRAAARDPGVGAVVLTGAGEAFCAGGDLAAMHEAGAGAPELFAALTRHLHPTVRLLATMDKATVAAVPGAAAGGGFGLALACDLRVASTAARFKPAYFTLGVVPDGGITHLLPQVVGPARARELLLLDEPVDAARALALGLVHLVVQPAKLLPEALALAARLAAAPREALGRTKRLLARGLHAGLEEQLRAERRWNTASASSAEFREGLTAFREKRAPRFPRPGGGPAAR